MHAPPLTTCNFCCLLHVPPLALVVFVSVFSTFLEVDPENLKPELGLQGTNLLICRIPGVFV